LPCRYVTLYCTIHPVRSNEVNCGHLRDRRDTTSSVVGDKCIEGQVVGVLPVVDTHFAIDNCLRLGRVVPSILNASSIALLIFHDSVFKQINVRLLMRGYLIDQEILI